MNTKTLLPVFLFFSILTFVSLNIPFFWDGTFFSGLSVYFFETGFHHFIALPVNDTGAFPFFSIYLTIAWKCFGKSLAVSHLAILPFLFGITYEYFKLANRFLNSKTIIFSMVLLMIEPVFITQSILMGYDLFICYFFLLALNSLYSNKKILYAITLIFLSLMSIRGTMLMGSLFLFDLLKNRNIRFSLVKAYIPSLLLWIFWAIYHQQQTGWYIFSPIRENNTEQFGDLKMLFRQLVYIIWKNIDFGRITLWLVFIYAIILQLKKKGMPKINELIQLIFIPLFVLSFFMILIKNPIGHKYFLPIFLTLNIAACYVLEQFKDIKTKRTLFTLITISLIGGNFIVYPQRYGNGWDSSLKMIPYFNLNKEMKSYIKEKKIETKDIASEFPLTNNSNYSYLNDTCSFYTDIEKNPIESYQYFLYSNIINTNRIEDLTKIKKDWVPENSISRGAVVITLYRNPNF